MSSHAPINRRSFLGTAGATALSFSVLPAQAASGRRLKIGIIGCGGRGTWMAKLFKEHGQYDLYACSDYFQDRVDTCGNAVGIPESRRFTRMSGYKKLLECGVDAVAIISPPYFHPQQAAEAVEAGLHTYVAKPIAVDVPGCKSIGQSGKRASRKNLCFLVDFQTRADAFYMEAIKRVHNGALGEFAFGESTYHAGNPFGGHMKALIDDPNNPELRLRGWGLSQVLSGDIITEQNIHTLDVMSWIMQRPPISAVGTGARKIRPVGDCYDTFSCLFQYENNVGITFSSRQFNGHGTTPEGIRNRMFGSEGVLETQYGGQVLLRGKHFYRGGKSPAIYRDGAVKNIADFYTNITQGDYTNGTVAPSVQSNLVTVLGRTAAYTQKTVTWKELMRCTKSLEYDFTGLKA